MCYDSHGEIMARKARKEFKTNVFSIVQQSNEKVFTDDHDRRAFIKILEQTQFKFGFLVYAYCLLDDYRFKLIIDVKKQSISRIMQSLVVSFTHYRNSHNKLFPQRFKSKPLYSKEEVMAEINNINMKTNSIFNSYCMVNKSLNQTFNWLTPIDNQPIEFIESTEPTTDQQLQNMLVDFLKQHDCDMVKIKINKELRNQCILRLRQQSNCSLKQIGILLGGLSESTISKIIKNHEH